MIRVRGGFAGAARLLGEHPVLLAVPLMVVPPLVVTAVAATLGVDAGRIPDALWFLGLVALTVVALRGRVSQAPPGAGAARRNLATLRERQGARGTPLLEVWDRGRLVRRAAVLVADGLPRPARGSATFECPVFWAWLDDEGRAAHATVLAVVGEDGRFVAEFAVGGRRASVTLDVARLVRVELDEADAREAPPREDEGVPRGVTPRAAAELAGEDLASPAGLTRARRSAAMRLHPDRPGGDGGLLAEINAAIDAYERRVGA